MKQTTSIFSCLFALIGFITIITTSILNEVMPKLGYVAFQAAATGSYSESSYKMNFAFVNILALLMIIIGVAISIRIFIMSNKQ